MKISVTPALHRSQFTCLMPGKIASAPNYRQWQKASSSRRNAGRQFSEQQLERQQGAERLDAQKGSRAGIVLVVIWYDAPLTRAEKKMDYYMGQLVEFAFGWAPRGFALCDGATLQISQNQALFSLIGNVHGGNAAHGTFNLPDKPGHCICVQGIYPSRG
jgi:hypothetical protein